MGLKIDKFLLKPVGKWDLAKALKQVIEKSKNN